ncbi:hypothetical protein OF377_00605 [Ureaplasma sp. ES3154-GEN]|uniref:hypothetical protein n=1 Tax=Ureaplasma sp. ES3154-GEN TaxID=2984844 RepID=UPI0021E773B4|nr:hypothetical protein [Ureaplasma sp. ES3154-GEN]MCV3743387.1 hypothetical protein [Ureaplasma sp. ES3154-GEN]
MKYNKLSYAEFSKLPKVKQIFTPWFISALVYSIVSIIIAGTMIGLANEGFDNARRLVVLENGKYDLKQVLDFWNFDTKNQDTLMSFVNYDPHADYQSWLGALKKLNKGDLHNLVHALHDGYWDEAIERLNEQAQANKDVLHEIVEYISHGAHHKIVNNNSTWGFVIKVLANPTDSWFSQVLKYISENNSHDSAIWKTRFDLIQDNANPAYHAYYWVFIVFMMPNMVSLIIIVVKLATVLKPKLNAEQKAQYKLEKAQKKLKTKEAPSSLTAGAL